VVKVTNGAEVSKVNRVKDPD